MKKKLPLVSVILLLLINCFPPSKVNAQTGIFSNAINGNNITANPFSSGQVLDANLNSTGIARANGLTSSGASNRYNASGWTTSGSLSSSDYFGFPLSPDPGYHINFNNFVYTGQRSSSGPSSFSFRNSSNSFGSNIGSPVSTGATISLAAAAYQNITSATEFRLYGFNSGNSSGTFSVNDFSFSGSVLGTTATNLTGFAACINTPGNAQSFTVNGSGLIPANALITIAPSPNYEISITSSTTGFLDVGSATFSASAGSVIKTVWVRLKANSSAGNYNGETINISGGGFNVASGINVSCSGTVSGNSTLSLHSAVGTDNQTKCINTSVTNITYLVGGSGTGASVAGLPAGVNGSYNSGSKIFTISGSPSVSGTFNYTVTTSGPCGNTSLNGNIEVTPASTLTLGSGVGSNIQAVCLGEPFTDIIYNVGGTGTGANVTGLPDGLSGSFDTGIFTISGTSTEAGIYNYTVTTTGPCGNPSLTGTLTVNTNSTLNLNSVAGTDGQTICVNTPIASISYLVGGGGTGATTAGLPTGLNGSYNPGSKIYTISGSASEAGTFNFTVTSTGPCVNTFLVGVINIIGTSTITRLSATGSDAQSICNNTSITDIVYSIGGTGTNAIASGLPVGISGNYLAGVFTISGTASVAGVYNYSVTSEGPCFNPTVSGTITVNNLPSAVNILPASSTICIGSTQSFVASAVLPNVNFINDNFSGLSVFQTGGNASGNRSQAFEIETSGSSVNSVATFTNGSGNIVVTTVGNSSIFGSGSATTTLTSPLLNTDGYSLQLLTFNHTYKQGNTGSPFGKIEVSTNNGSSWTTLKTYTTNQGSSTSFVSDNVDLSAFSNSASLLIRFNFEADIANFFNNNSAWWAIDDVLLNGTPIMLYSWHANTGSSLNGLPLNAGSPLVSNESIDVMPTTTTTYTLTATGQASGCTGSTTGVVEVNQHSTLDISSGMGSENQDICINTAMSSITYSIGGDGTGAFVTGLPVGVTGNFSSNQFTINGTPTESGIFNYVVTTTGPCINPSLGGTLTIKTPPTIGEISGPINGCQYTGLSGVVATYAITSSDPSSVYVWNIPNGATDITGQGTATISFKFPSGYLSGNISVTVTGSCGEPINKTLLIQNAGPEIPGEISGPVNACPYIGTGEEITYSIEPVAFANSYQWTVPSTMTIVSGQGTTNLTVTINVGFDASSNPVTRLIRVHSVSGCANSADKLKYLFAQFPSTPGPIAGSTNICDVIGTSNTVAYTVRKVIAATSYAWTTQSGTTTVTHPNGPGINDTIILVSFDAGFSTSLVTVAAVNGCGTSGSVRSLSVKRTSSSTPGLISGPTNVCPNILPEGLEATYSVVPVSGATSYTWTAPPGAQVTHPNTTGPDDYIINVLFPPGFVNGTISVSSTNGCGTSGIRTLALSRLNPATPGIIDVIQTQSCPNREFSYTLANVPANASTLEWNIPLSEGAVLVNQTATSITVAYPQTSVVGEVTVQALNNCGSSSIRSTKIKLPACAPEEGKFAKGNSKESRKTTTDESITANQKIDTKIFPNPSATDFNIRVLTAGKKAISLRILDMEGRELKQFTVLPEKIITIGSSLKPGVYILEIRKDNKTESRRLVKF